MSTTDGEKIAGIAQQMEDFKEDLSEIKDDVKKIRESLNPVTNHELRLTNLEKSSNFWKWASPSFAAIAGSILTYLLLFFLQNMKQ